MATAVAVTLIVLFPHCRGGPMSGVPADQWPTWLGHAAGMAPLWTKSPSTMVLLALAPAAALMVAARNAWREPGDRALWLALLAMAAIGALAMLTSARSANLANVVGALHLADAGKRP